MELINIFSITSALLLLFVQMQSCINISMPMTLNSKSLFHVNCIKVDLYRPDVLLLCASNAVFEFHLQTEQTVLIAGDPLIAIAGYAEGEGEDAKFNWVQDIVQLDADILIVSDAYNHCLRTITSGNTSMLAGRCQSRGFQDGDFLAALFKSPRGLLLSYHKLWVCDFDNNGLRMLTMTSRQVSTVYIDEEKLQRPHRITCLHPQCDQIYITRRHGITLYNRTEVSLEVLSGSRSAGVALGSLSETMFDRPQGLIFLTKDTLLVADTDNQRLVELDLLDQNSSRSFPLDPGFAYALLCYNNSLYLGSDRVHKYELSDLPVGFLCDQLQTLPTVEPSTITMLDITETTTTSSATTTAIALEDTSTNLQTTTDTSKATTSTPVTTTTTTTVTTRKPPRTLYPRTLYPRTTLAFIPRTFPTTVKATTRTTPTRQTTTTKQQAVKITEQPPRRTLNRTIISTQLSTLVVTISIITAVIAILIVTVMILRVFTKRLNSTYPINEDQIWNAQWERGEVEKGIRATHV